MKIFSQRFIRGFTYVELLMALAVSGLVAAAGFEALRQSRTGFAKMADRIEEQGDVNMAFAVFRQDFRTATLHDDYFFSGYAGESSQNSRLSFVRAGQQPGTYFQIDYFVAEDGFTGEKNLTRQCRSLEGGQLVEDGGLLTAARHVEKIQFQFFDGTRWLDSWGWSLEKKRPTHGMKGLPWAVRVELLRRNDKGSEVSAEAVFPIMVGLLNGDAS